MFHKGLNFYSDKRFDNAFMSKTCQPIMLNGGTLTERINCAIDKIPEQKILEYTLLRPTILFGRIEWTY